MYGYIKPKPLKEVPVEDLGGGLNEAAPPNKVPFRECLIAENIRVSEDGKTKEKRAGLTKLDSIYDFVSKKVYGAFGIEKEEEVEIAAFLEDDIQLKSGNEWESIFSPTKTIDKPISVVQDKGLVLVAGYEKLITIKEGQAAYSGIEAADHEVTVETQAASADKKSTAEYPDSNQDHCGELGQAAAQTLLAQSFKVEVDCDLTKITLKLKKVGSPTGNLWAEIHETKSGTSTTKNASPGIVGQGSGNLDVSTIVGSFLTVTDTSIAFVSSTKKITDSNNGLAGFLTGDKIKVTGSVDNDGVYTVATGGVAGEIVVTEDLVDEDAGDSITIERIYELAFSGTKPSLDKNTTYYLVVYRSFSVDPDDHVVVGFDCSSPEYSDGKYWEIDGSLDWGGYSSVDLVFEIHGLATAEVELKSSGALETGYSDTVHADITFWYSAQSFKVDLASELSEVRLPLRRTIFPPGATVWVEIHSNKTGTRIGCKSDTRDKDDIDLINFNWITFPFSGTKPSLSGDTTYYLILYASWDPPIEGRCIYWTRTQGGGIYGDGQRHLINYGGNWSDLSEDYSFKIYGYETAEVKVVEYALSNLDDIKELREANGATLLAQEFKVYEDADVSKVKLYLSKVGSLTGKFIWAEIHSARGGTSETKNLSDNIVPQASDNVDADSLSAFPTYGWVTFTFSGTKPAIEADTVYYIVIYGDFDVSSSNYVRVGMDKIDPDYTVGKRWDIDDQLEWGAKEDIDFIFELWTSIGDLVGDYSFVVTYLRWGNYPCESNPSPPSETVNIIAGKEFKLTNIPVSSDPEVTHKNIYRTEAGGEKRYWVERILNSEVEYLDSLPDSGLGDEVSYDSYPPPPGDCIEIWDDTLWVSGVPGYMEGLFRSRLGYLEQFPATATSYMPLREGEADQVIRTKEFKNVLYPFKSNSIWVIGRSGESYIMDKIVSENGLGAAGSLVDCGEFLMFLSNYYKIELFDGYKIITPKMSNKVKKTLRSINKTYAYRSTAQYYEPGNEYRLSIPTGSSMIPNKVIVYNTETKNFFVDTYHQNICSISVLDITKGERVMLYGTSEGELYRVDPDATTDGGQPINMRFRTGWIGSQKWLMLRKMWIDFILPENKILIFKVYSNFRHSPELNINLQGSTPTGADPELRNVIHQKVGMAIKGSFFSFEFINVEDIEGLLQVISLWLYLKIKPSKRTIKAS